jgi:hypothetical protein
MMSGAFSVRKFWTFRQSWRLQIMVEDTKGNVPNLERASAGDLGL